MAPEVDESIYFCKNKRFAKKKYKFNNVAEIVCGSLVGHPPLEGSKIGLREWGIN